MPQIQRPLIYVFRYSLGHLFRARKGAVKVHTLLDLRGSVPSFIWITHGKVHDVKILDELIPEPGAIYLMDRAYIDFARLYLLHRSQAFFIIRTKSNCSFRRIYSHPVDKATGLLCDQTIVLSGFYTSKDYPEKLRRIKFYDKEHNRTLLFLINNFTLSALTICQLYKYRWKVELFLNGSNNTYA